MKNIIIVLTLSCVLAGCVSTYPREYVGAWGGRDRHSNDGIGFQLDCDGSGRVTSYIGILPVKWHPTGDNRLEVIITDGGQGIGIYELKYLPDSEEMMLMHKKFVHFYAGRESDEKTYDNFKLQRSNELADCLAKLAAQHEKELAEFKKTHPRKKPPKPKTETIEKTLGSWKDAASLAEDLKDGWSLSFRGDGQVTKPWISLNPTKNGASASLSIFANSYAIGNPEDKYELDEEGNVWSPAGAIPASATVTQPKWDENDEARTIALLREKKWTVSESVYYQGHFFFCLYNKRYNVDFGEMPLEEILLSIGDCFDDKVRPPLKVTLWRSR